MPIKKWAFALATLVVASMVLIACPAPEPQVVEKVVTQVVEKEVKVIETQVVEKEVRVIETVEVEKIVEKRATRGGSVVFALDREPDTLDPHVSSSRYDAHVEHQVYESLLCYNTEDQSYRPSLATGLELTEDGLGVIVHLRDDVKFHDGTPFDAEAVKINVERIQDPATKSESAVYTLGPVESVEVIDDYTIKFNYSHKYGNIEYGLSNIAMISPAAIEEYGQTLYENMVGTGPFIFREWEARDHITLVRNPDYNWASGCATHAGPAYLEAVTFKFMPEANARMTAIEKNEADLVIRVPPDTWPAWTANPNFKTAKTPQGGIGTALELNVTKPPTNDVRVRQALNYLLDKEEMVYGMSGGIQTPMYGIISPYTRGYNPECELYDYDVDKGLALLDEAGWILNEASGLREKDDEPMLIDYLSLPADYLANLAVIVQDTLAEYGITVEVTTEDFPAQQQHGQQGIYNIIAWTGWGGQEPVMLRQLFGCENVGVGWNFSQYCDEEAQALMEAADAEPVAEKRYDIYGTLQIKLMEDAVMIPININARLWVMDPDIFGFRTVGGEQVEFYDMYRLVE